MKRAGELRQQAEHYRQLRKQINDPAAVQAICDLAAEFEVTAAELGRRHHIRERAHEIWAEHGRPEGRDVEFWLKAERELSVQDVPEP
jgi:predicted NAD-dependent protein-ADP-ribosyltransferase YbiA (DUF1768 family)